MTEPLHETDSDERLRRLIGRMLGEAEVCESSNWYFTLTDTGTGLSGVADLDAELFHHLYERQSMSSEARPVLRDRLAKNGRNGGHMIRVLAHIPAKFLSSKEPFLRGAIEDDQFRAEHPEFCNAIGERKKALRLMRFPILAARKLVEWFGENPGGGGYMSRWLGSNLLRVDSPMTNTELIDKLNQKFDNVCRNKPVHERYQFLSREFIAPLVGGKGHLDGVGNNMLQYGLRCWHDVKVWKYMFKLDSTNKDFWKRAFSRLGIQHNPNCLVSLLCDHLTKDQIEDGALAKLNAYVYWLVGSGGLLELYLSTRET